MVVCSDNDVASVTEGYRVAPLRIAARAWEAGCVGWEDAVLSLGIDSFAGRREIEHECQADSWR